MHELSMMSSLFDSIESLAKEHGFQKITSITLEIGKMRAAVPGLLKDAFAELSAGSVCEGAELIIEEIDVDLICRVCHRHIEREDSLLEGCPECGSHRIRLIKGNELKIRQIAGVE